MKKPTQKQYRDALLATMESYLPRSYPCGKCAWPVIDGYVCQHCGDSNPKAKTVKGTK